MDLEAGAPWRQPLSISVSRSSPIANRLTEQDRRNKFSRAFPIPVQRFWD